MPLFGLLILILLSALNHDRHNLTLSHPIASYFARHNLPRLSANGSQQRSKATFSRSTISADLQKYINHLAILFHSPPDVILLPADFDKYFIDLEGIAIAAGLSRQSLGNDFWGGKLQCL